MVEAARHAVLGANRYPDPSYTALRRALADRYDVPWERIALGEGSCDLLLAAGDALLEPGAELDLRLAGVQRLPAPGRRVRRARDRGAADAATPCTTSTRSPPRSPSRRGWCCICNPNNPTGTALPLEQIEAFLQQVPDHVCVILDEAYVEFSLTVGDPFASLPLLDRHPNLVILRTFSKVYGLAGLRVGYGLCGSESFRIAVDQVRQPFYLTSAAQAAARRGAQVPGRGRAPRRRHRRGAHHRDRGAARARLLGRRERRQLHLGAAGRGRRRRPGGRRPARARRGRARRHARWAARASARVTLGTDAENAAFLAALAGR